MFVTGVEVCIESGHELVPLEETQRRALSGSSVSLAKLMKGEREVERVRADMKCITVRLSDGVNICEKVFKSRNFKTPTLHMGLSILDELAAWQAA